MFKCKDLLSLPTMSRAKLIAGEGGLNKGIRWAYKAENMKFADWVHGQELLVVSTPVISCEDFDLYKLIQEAIRLSISGVIMLVGDEYISSVETKTIALADKSNLPIFALPGEIPLVDIFEELGHAISYEDKSFLDYDNILSQIVFGNHVDERAIIRQASVLAYELLSPQRVFMIKVELPENVVPQGFMSSVAAQLQTLFFTEKSEAIVSHFHLNLVGLTSEQNSETLNSIFNQFEKLIKERNSEIACKIGIGCSYEEISLFERSFSEASMCLRFAKPVQWYEELGFLKVLMNVDNHKLLSDYMNMVIGRIIKYDTDNRSELLNTLIAYFDCDENMKEVARSIYIHPNTVKYRIQKIQDLSGLNLSISHEKMELYNAVLIWKFLADTK